MLRPVCSKLGLSDKLKSTSLQSMEKVSYPFVPLHTQVIDKNLALKTQKPPLEEPKKSNSLAIIFAWLLAKGRHIDRYSSLYLNQGFDVLTVNVTPKELIFPTTGTQFVAQKVLDYLESHPEYEKVVVHAFSVGCYMFGECLVKMKEGGRKYLPITKKISGIICDSAVDYYTLPEGLSKAMFSNHIARNAMQRSINVYMHLFYKMSTKHYIKSSRAFHNNFLTCPALFLLSKNDVIASVEEQKKVVKTWTKNGSDTHIKCWEKSGHVSHMHAYPEEYTAEVYALLDKAGLLKSE